MIKYLTNEWNPYAPEKSQEKGQCIPLHVQKGQILPLDNKSILSASAPYWKEIKQPDDPLYGNLHMEKDLWK